MDTDSSTVISHRHANGEVYTAPSMEVAQRVCPAMGGVSVRQAGILLRLEDMGNEIIADEAQQDLLSESSDATIVLGVEYQKRGEKLLHEILPETTESYSIAGTTQIVIGEPLVISAPVTNNIIGITSSARNYTEKAEDSVLKTRGLESKKPESITIEHIEVEVKGSAEVIKEAPLIAVPDTQATSIHEALHERKTDIAIVNQLEVPGSLSPTSIEETYIDEHQLDDIKDYARTVNTDEEISDVFVIEAEHDTEKLDFEAEVEDMPVMYEDSKIVIEEEIAQFEEAVQLFLPEEFTNNHDLLTEIVTELEEIKKCIKVASVEELTEIEADVTVIIENLFRALNIEYSDKKAKKLAVTLVRQERTKSEEQDDFNYALSDYGTYEGMGLLIRALNNFRTASSSLHIVLGRFALFTSRLKVSFVIDRVAV